MEWDGRMDGDLWSVWKEGRNAITATVAKQCESESRKEDGGRVAFVYFFLPFLSQPRIGLFCSQHRQCSVGCYDTRVSESDTRRVVVRLETFFFLPLQRDPKPTRRLVFHVPSCMFPHVKM